jgi:RNA polymerase sigma-70 factor (ECF subfamily)
VAIRATFGCLRRVRRARAQVDGGADLEAVPHPDAPPDEYIARRRAVALLDRIPDEQRHALVLHHVLGMSVPDISADLGVPLETVRSRLRIGIGKLRALHGGESC